MNAVLAADDTSPDDLPKRPAQIQVRMRRMAFEMEDDDIPAHWAAGSKFETHWYNALSAVFPEGEKFFIDSVRNLEERIDDPALRDQIRGFVGQEGHHTFQHRVLNDAAARAGVDLSRYDRRLKSFLDLLRRFYPKSWQLAVTCAIEHLTAILGHQVLAHDYELSGMHPKMAPIWRWHAVEETEHKAVCFDVYQRVDGGYWKRVLLMVSTTLIFFPIVFSTQIGLMLQDQRPTRLADVARGMWRLWGLPGPLRRMIPEYLSYYRPSFHPWQHDNLALVRKWLCDERTSSVFKT